MLLDLWMVADREVAEAMARSEETDEPILKSADIVQRVQLPAAGREALLRGPRTATFPHEHEPAQVRHGRPGKVVERGPLTRLGLLLAVEGWGWQSATAGRPDWQFVLSRQVRRFRGVGDSDHYWSIRTIRPSSRAPGGRAMRGEAWQWRTRIFISHASADRKLADLLSDTLVLGGIPRDRIFYSSARATHEQIGSTA